MSVIGAGVACAPSVRPPRDPEAPNGALTTLRSPKKARGAQGPQTRSRAGRRPCWGPAAVGGGPPRLPPAPPRSPPTGASGASGLMARRGHQSLGTGVSGDPSEALAQEAAVGGVRGLP
eukprot:4997930-Alexandrium_andersonii.AAC.2